MTTLATARLLLPPSPQLLPDLSTTAAAAVAVSASPESLLFHKMHPDKILMHVHGVTSPRLCSSGQLLKTASYLTGNSMDYPSEMPPEDDDLNDEVASVCDSEGSELSVGQENCDNRRSSSLLTSDVATSEDNVTLGTPLADDLVDPFPMGALRIPTVPVIRPSPTRLQEELLRKSHVYAEELVKQQMQIMAAARANAFSAENIHPFSGIHSHLSAISKMTQMSQITQGAGESALSKLTAFGLVAQSSNSSAPSLNQFQQHMQAHLPFMNNNIHEPSLKFSIDNILKADFGRRITEPLIKLGGSGNAAGTFTSRGRTSRKSDKNTATSSKAPSSNPIATGAPIDLTSSFSGMSPTGNLTNTHCTNSNDSTSTVLSSNYSNSVKSPNTPSTAASPSESTTGAAVAPPTGSALDSPAESGSGSASTSSGAATSSSSGPIVWPAWVYCTRYSDRPSSGRSPRTRKPKKSPGEKGTQPPNEDKRPRTAFSGSQLARLKHEFTENRYLTEKRRQQLSAELGLNEAQIKIWFQNKRAKIKKSSGTKNPLALQLMAQGLYNHSTIPLTKEEEELQELQAKAEASA